MILKKLLSVVLLVSSSGLGAQESAADGPPEAPGSHTWQNVSMDMSPEAYSRAYRENQRYLRHLFKSHATATLTSLGVSENLVGVLGAAAKLAFDPDARLKLNRSKTLALQFSDVSEEKRAVQIGYTLRW